jgi:hypothetical protein
MRPSFFANAPQDKSRRAMAMGARIGLWKNNFVQYQWLKFFFRKKSTKLSPLLFPEPYFPRCSHGTG